MYHPRVRRLLLLLTPLACNRAGPLDTGEDIVLGTSSSDALTTDADTTSTTSDSSAGGSDSSAGGSDSSGSDSDS